MPGLRSCPAGRCAKGGSNEGGGKGGVEGGNGEGGKIGGDGGEGGIAGGLGSGGGDEGGGAALRRSIHSLGCSRSGCMWVAVG